MSTIDVGASAISDRPFPVWAAPAERLRFLLGYAVLAPSRHNTQPWIFEIAGDELRLYADLRRALKIADPDDRELVMACGAALFNLRVAAAHFGYATSTEVLAERRRDGLLARMRLEERRAASPELETLFRAIPRRRTNRLPLDSREAPEGLIASLVREAHLEGGALRTVEPHQRRAVAELIAEGDRLEWSNPRFRLEMASWIRPNGTRRRDGMPGYAQGISGPASYIQPIMMRLSNPAEVEAERDRRRALNTRALVVLSTRGDAPSDWLAAGQALERVLLRATGANLYASYFSQPIEVPELRARLREALGEAGHPQMMFRLGYGLEVKPTPRRKVDEVLRSLDAAAPLPQPLAVRH